MRIVTHHAGSRKVTAYATIKVTIYVLPLLVIIWKGSDNPITSLNFFSKGYHIGGCFLCIAIMYHAGAKC